MDLYTFLFAHQHQALMVASILRVALIIGLVIAFWSMRKDLARLGRGIVALGRDGVAAVRHARRRANDKQFAAAEDAVKDYAAVLNALVILTALRRTGIPEGTKRATAQEANEMLDNAKSFREMTRIHLATMSDLTIGYIATALAKDGWATIDQYTAFLEQERRDALLDRCDVNSHVARRNQIRQRH